MSAAKEVKAAFDVERHKLTVMTNGTGTGSVASSPAGISCGATCHAEYEHGTAVVLTATPGTHTAPATWSGCDDIVSGNKCEVSMTSAKTVTATFNLIQFALTVAKAGPGAPNSTVASTPAGTISCGTACSALLTEGATLTLTATSGPNVAPVIWSGCTSVGKKNECLLTMSAAKAVTATFEPVGGVEVLALDVAKAGNGEGTITGSPGGIECGSVCETELVEGAVVSLSATPAPGSVFGHWSGGGCTGAGPCVTTLRTARTVTATFLLSGTRTLSVSKSGSGQGTVTSRPVGTGIDCGQTCSAPVPAGTAVILTAKAAKGSSFGHWSGACFGTAASCKVTMSEARSVGASFSAPPAAAAPPPPPSRKPPRCKQGFKRRRVHGKPRCVKKHKHQAKRGASHQRG
jgi:hypothetical protein